MNLLIKSFPARAEMKELAACFLLLRNQRTEQTQSEQIAAEIAVNNNNQTMKAAQALVLSGSNKAKSGSKARN